MILSAVWSDVGRSLREAFFMFWETLWPLVVGFGLSGAVQAFASRDQLRRSLGDHRPATLVRSSALGMASSSCSYAASAMAKSLFQKGADFTTALVFMFASTNLVVELGIVLAVLMGWQFTAAEFAGGPVMIVLLAGLGGLVLRPRVVEAARRRLGATVPAGTPEHAVAPVLEVRPHEPARARWSQWSRIVRSRAAWADAAGYALADLRMLRKELVAGFVVAGFLATLVPTAAWHAVFTPGHGFGTSLENVVVGPVIAFLSSECSVGNVPLAATLWKGGISFGGVISFLFADLMAAPLVLIYRRYYGGAVTARLVALFWVVIAAAGLIVQAVFSSAGLVPHHRPVQIVPISFHWDYTTVLDLVSLGVAAYLYRLCRRRGRLGAGAGHATDPVCGMQVTTADAPAIRVQDGRTVWFCSDRCAERFAPARVPAPSAAAAVTE